MDRGIRHAVFLERYKGGTANQIVAFMEREVYPDLMARTQARLERLLRSGRINSVGVFRTKRYIDMVSGMREQIRSGLRVAHGNLRSELRKFAISEAQWQQAVLGASTPIDLGFTLPATDQLRAIVTQRPLQGRLLREWFSSTSRAAIDGFEQQIKIGMTQGESVEQIVRRLRGPIASKWKAGQTGRISNNLRAVTRTAVQGVAAQAREQLYRDNDDLIKGVRWVSTLDARTTDICKTLDGRVFPPGEGERPPIHVQCRSTTVPVVRSWKELGINLREAPPGTRASLTGAVPADVTYPQWLRRQPVAIQNQALGVGRAQLWRRGVVPIERFVDPTGRPLSLVQLEALEKSLS